MSLEYAIEFPCEMRRRHGEPALRSYGRSGALVSRIVRQTLETERTPSPESVEFTASLSADLEESEAISAYCRDYCPAHIDAGPDDEAAEREPIGCLGRIRYPIEAYFERFIADRVQLLCDTTPREDWPALLRILVDPESPFDGELTKELRRVTTPEGLRFFELRLPVSLALHTTRLTTDHIFDLLSGFAASDEGASGYQRELPVMALEDYSEFLEAILLDGLLPSETARLQSRGATYNQFVRFAKAVRLAESLGVRVLMD
jgi:hypothetical protein